MERRSRTKIQKVFLPLSQALDDFLSEKESQNCRKPTLDNYKLMCGKFIEIVGDKSTSDLTKKDYDYFLSVLKQDGRKNETSVQSYCRVVRVFLYYLQDNGMCESFTIQLPRTQKTIKHLYTDAELSALLKKPSDDCLESEYMSWVITNLVLATGLRLNSIVNLKVSDVEGNLLTVNVTKSNRALLLTLNPECEKIVKKYIKLFRLQSDDFLFCTQDFNQYQVDSIKKYIRKFNLGRGVQKTSLHLLRHTFASRFYAETGDIYALSRILGHAEISTTQRYLRGLGEVDLSQKMSAFSIQASLGDTPRKRRGRMRTA